MFRNNPQQELKALFNNVSFFFFFIWAALALHATSVFAKE